MVLGFIFSLIGAAAFTILSGLRVKKIVDGEFPGDFSKSHYIPTAIAVGAAAVYGFYEGELEVALPHTAEFIISFILLTGKGCRIGRSTL